jgi:haloacid dehalogenase superfamily, subfamily IA, variant 3 with third motif having DD or ED/haloacid dehalogenase superfamily, subfamily IA, variant 1 with third motif having Dx(3-4)D or Dx(3-4)E
MIVQTLILDFDMTLVNSLPAITRGLNKMARHFKLPEVTEDDTRRVISLETRDFWQSLWGYYDEAWADFFLKEVADREKYYLEMTPGAEDLLKRLKSGGVSLGLATNRNNAWAALASVGLAAYFDTAVGSGDVNLGKPAPDMLFLAMDQLHADPGQTIYVGDAVFDMLAAKRAGIRAIGLLEGGTSKEELLEAGAWQVRQNLSDLNDLLQSL